VLFCDISELARRRHRRHCCRCIRDWCKRNSRRRGSTHSDRGEPVRLLDNSWTCLCTASYLRTCRDVL